MSGLNWRVILVGLCIATLGHSGWTDMDMPADTPPPVVKKPVKKHHKKHSKPVKKEPTEATAPKVLTLSNDDLPKRHRNYGTPDSNSPETTTTAPITNTSGMTRQTAPAAAAAPAPIDPNAALQAVAPRIAPTSDPMDVPTPDASAVHSTSDLDKPLPTTSIH